MPQRVISQVPVRESFRDTKYRIQQRVISDLDPKLDLTNQVEVRRQIEEIFSVAVDEAGRPKAKTSHTLNPVPFVLFDPRGEFELAGPGDPGLANVAATVLGLLGFKAPEGYFPTLLRED